MKDFRKLKVKHKYVRRKWDSKVVPSINIEGEWVKAAGFITGEECSIMVEHGRITILSI